MNAGTLAGTTTSLQGNILDNANVTFDQDTNDSTSASISGGGTLTKLGSGTVTLAGAMFYAGGTTITGGALQGTTASLKGSISTATGTSVILVQDSSGSNFSGTITGQGSLIKNGAGTITLQGGPNSYSGGTTINAGSLVGDTTTLQGDITDNATFGLSFDQVTDGAYAGQISASGGVGKFGAGTLTLTGTNSYTGGTTITQGTLRLGTGGSLAPTGVVILGSPGVTFDINGHDQTIGGLDGSTGTIELGDGTLTDAQISPLQSSFVGTINGTGSLVKAGVGTLLLFFSSAPTPTAAAPPSAGAASPSPRMPAWAMAGRWRWKRGRPSSSKAEGPTAMP